MKGDISVDSSVGKGSSFNIILKDIPIDVIFTSNLISAQMTLFLAMVEHNDKKVFVTHLSSPRSTIRNNRMVK